MSLTHLLFFCRIAVLLVFAMASLGKMLELKEFQMTIREFELLPRPWARPVALIFVGGEVLVVLAMLAGGSWLPLGFLIGLTLLVVFAGALFIVLRRKPDMSCNCFGRSDHRISWYDPIRNLLLTLCCAGGLLASYSVSQGLIAGEMIVLGMMAAAFVGLATHVGDVVKTLRRPFSIIEYYQ
jgi:hypothetical protein